MVTIRLARAGATKRPFYHVVATEKSSPRDGRFIERLGYYNPSAKGAEQKLVVDNARVEHWQKNGAQTSERVTYLLKSAAKAA
ncbi:MAG: 30S ribosomal protein S16 [Stenotrophobium sp.]